jgi:hypothetical protein
MMSGVYRDELLRSQEQQWDQLREYISAYAAHLPVRKVAVVGNAPLAPDPDRAAEIDSSDLVIRVNEVWLDPPGSSPTIGTACHVVLLSKSATMTRWVLHDYRRRAYLIPQAGFVQYRLENRIGLQLTTAFWPADLGAMPLPNAVVKTRVTRLLDPQHKPGSLIPTTGTMGIVMAHEMFPGVDLVTTGFSFLDDSSQKHWAHHSGSSTRVNWQHRLDLEAKLLKSWIADGSARFLR